MGTFPLYSRGVIHSLDGVWDFVFLGRNVDLSAPRHVPEGHPEYVCREVIDNPKLAGVALWPFCDCRTYSSALALDRPRAFNNRGVVDEYRRLKLAYKTVRRLFTHGTGSEA